MGTVLDGVRAARPDAVRRGPPHGFGAVIFTLILLWAAIELGVMLGEDGATRFGPSPLAGRAA
jgi:uncharacterized membrane protein YhaH (DUF805 family)